MWQISSRHAFLGITSAFKSTRKGSLRARERQGKVGCLSVAGLHIA
jgi:hypothetical protein